MSVSAWSRRVLAYAGIPLLVLGCVIVAGASRQAGPVPAGESDPPGPLLPWEDEPDPGRRIRLLLESSRRDSPLYPHVIEAIKKYRINDPSLYPALLEAIQDRERAISEQAMLAIAGFSHAPPELVVSLARLIRPRPGAFSEMAAIALGSLHEDARPAADTLLGLGLFTDPDPKIRYRACCLARKINDPGLLQAAARLIDDEDHNVRNAAYMAMNQLLENHPIPRP